ncbi:hypothetical protein WN943_024769 [Citrus x changshan-huyou]
MDKLGKATTRVDRTLEAATEEVKLDDMTRVFVALDAIHEQQSILTSSGFHDSVLGRHG